MGDIVWVFFDWVAERAVRRDEDAKWKGFVYGKWVKLMRGE